MAIVYPSQKGSALTCNELEQNFREFLKRSNHTGLQPASTISDLGTVVEAYPFITNLKACCTTLTMQLNQLQQDLFGQGELATLIATLQAQIQSIISNLDNAINNSSTVQDLQECCEENSTAINNLGLDINDLQQDIAALNASIANLNSLLNTKANINSPTLTGVPQAPTPASNATGTQIATVQFVRNSLDALEAILAPITDKLALLNTTTYIYIDNNLGNDTTGDGTATRPFKTPTAAFEFLKSQLSPTAGAIVLKFRPGTYTMPPQFNGISIPLHLEGEPSNPYSVVIRMRYDYDINVKYYIGRTLNVNQCREVYINGFTFEAPTNLIPTDKHLYRQNHLEIGRSVCNISNCVFKPMNWNPNLPFIGSKPDTSLVPPNVYSTTTYSILAFGSYIALGNGIRIEGLNSYANHSFVFFAFSDNSGISSSGTVTISMIANPACYCIFNLNAGSYIYNDFSSDEPRIKFAGNLYPPNTKVPNNTLIVGNTFESVTWPIGGNLFPPNHTKVPMYYLDPSKGYYVLGVYPGKEGGSLAAPGSVINFG